jgi:hypothetical protein
MLSCFAGALQLENLFPLARNAMLEEFQECQFQIVNESDSSLNVCTR